MIEDKIRHYEMPELPPSRDHHDATHFEMLRDDRLVSTLEL